ncbi:pyocin knob domain-containing protein [Chelatococcus sp. XZ-Ab1]|uniref:pyocin knob domain-containing protein n=1 Tax=Chelatococcus sp. XZ-Ab1 TaxID=3034027 RepID=UPI0023E45EBF|nr:pyocin knob domain-containing protein [Chelatococcus sp. XZ-Ab1]
MMSLEKRIRFGQLPPAGSIRDADIVVGEQGGVAVQYPFGAVGAYLAQLLSDFVVAPDGTDFNSLGSRCTYILTSELNAPLAGASNRWVVEVIDDPADEDRLFQRATLLVGGTKLISANRRRLSGGAWEPWGIGTVLAGDVGWINPSWFADKTNVEDVIVDIGGWLYSLQGEVDALPIDREFVSSEQTITALGTITLAHGLGVEPRIAQPYLICKTANAGYSVGDVLASASYVHTEAGVGHFGVTIKKDATNVVIKIANGIKVANFANGAGDAITLGSWRLVVRALA